MNGNTKAAICLFVGVFFILLSLFLSVGNNTQSHYTSSTTTRIVAAPGIIVQVEILKEKKDNDGPK